MSVTAEPVSSLPSSDRTSFACKDSSRTGVSSAGSNSTATATASLNTTSRTGVSYAGSDSTATASLDTSRTGVSSAGSDSTATVSSEGKFTLQLLCSQFFSHC